MKIRYALLTLVLIVLWVGAGMSLCFFRYSWVRTSEVIRVQPSEEEFLNFEKNEDDAPDHLRFLMFSHDVSIWEKVPGENGEDWVRLETLHPNFATGYFFDNDKIILREPVWEEPNAFAEPSYYLQCRVQRLSATP